MDNTAKNMIIVIITFLSLFFIIWNWDISINFYQVFIILLVIIVVILLLFVFRVSQSSNSFLKQKSKYLIAYKHCTEIWSEFTDGNDRLTYIDFESLSDVFIVEGKKMSVYAFIISRNVISLEKIIFFYCLETKDIIGQIPHPDSDQLKNPFDYCPLKHEEQFNGRNNKNNSSGMYVNVNTDSNKEKLKLDNETEDGEKNAR